MIGCLELTKAGSLGPLISRSTGKVLELLEAATPCRAYQNDSKVIFNLIEGSLEVYLPTIWTVEKAVLQERRSTGAERKKINRREMLEKSRNAVFFNVLCVGWVEK